MPDGQQSLGAIEPIEIQEEMSRSFMDYAMSVIVSRALPDARDGLKPVHRRILYGMYDRGLRPERPYVKCAQVVGHVMGNYHPHGDTAIYDALARMAQSFSLRHPLVDGHGNFGSPDPNDRPAAMRYTECRLAPLAMHMLAGHLAGHFDSMTPTFSAPKHNAHTETPHTSFVTTPIAKVILTAAAMMTPAAARRTQCERTGAGGGSNAVG